MFDYGIVIGDAFDDGGFEKVIELYGKLRNGFCIIRNGAHKESKFGSYPYTHKGFYPAISINGFIWAIKKS